VPPEAQAEGRCAEGGSAECAAPCILVQGQAVHRAGALVQRPCVAQGQAVRRAGTGRALGWNAAPGRTRPHLAAPGRTRTHPSYQNLCV
jgi:hypothetical protein